MQNRVDRSNRLPWSWDFGHRLVAVHWQLSPITLARHPRRAHTARGIAIFPQGTKEATSEDDLSANAIIPQQLYRMVFPDAPRVSRSETLEDKEARKALMGRLWGFCKPDDESYVQKHLEHRKRKLVLCEAHIEVNVEVLDEPLSPLPIGRFITANEELIVTYFFTPRAKKTVRAAVNLNLGNDLVIRRLPQMRTRLAIETADVIGQVTGALPTGDVKAAKALTAQRAAEARRQSDEEEVASA